MVNNTTNINKTNNHLSTNLIEHKKTVRYGIGKYWSCLGTGTKMWLEQTAQWDPNPPPLVYWISDGHSDIMK